MVTIEKIEHVNALDKALRTLKFEVDDEDAFIFAGSPYIARVQHQLHMALLRKNNPDLSSEGLQELHIADCNFRDQKHLFVKVRDYLEKARKWNFLSIDVKKEYIISIVSPYFIDESFLMELIEETDAFHS